MPARITRLVAILVVLPVLLSACTALQEGPRTQEGQAKKKPAVREPAPYPGYLAARFNDLLDVVPFSLGVGPGLFAGVHLPGFGTGLGVTTRVDRLGWPARPDQAVRAGTWFEFMEAGLVIGNARTSEVVNYDVVYVPFGPMRGEHGPGGTEWPQLLDVEATVHVGYVGARAGVSPVQLADFLLGWFGVDLAEDDVPRRPGRRDRP